MKYMIHYSSSGFVFMLMLFYFLKRRVFVIFAGLFGYKGEYNDIEGRHSFQWNRRF